MASLLPPGVVQYHEISHLLIFGEIMTYFRECDVITMGIPPKIGDSLQFRSDFVSECAFRHPNWN